MAARRPLYPQARAIAVRRDERSAATGRWLVLGLALIAGFAVVAWSGAGRAAPMQQNPRQNLPIASPDFAPLEKWSGAIARDRAAGAAPWQGFLAEMRGASRAAQLVGVNRFVNGTRFVSDAANWGVRDYWAAPGEFFARGGDCEDYAIAKYLALRALGFPAQALRLLVLIDTLRGRPHAVLLVQSGGRTLVLDNQTDAVRPWDAVPFYRALYSVNETGAWIHVSVGDVLRLTSN